MFWVWATALGTALILPLIRHSLNPSVLGVQNTRRKRPPQHDPHLRDLSDAKPSHSDANRASPSIDLEKPRVRLAIAITGIVMVPVVVVGILVAVTLGANPLVSAPLVIFVGGLMSKIVPYYFPARE